MKLAFNFLNVANFILWFLKFHGGFDTQVSFYSRVNKVIENPFLLIACFVIFLPTLILINFKGENHFKDHNGSEVLSEKLSSSSHIFGYFFVILWFVFFLFINAIR